MDNEKVWIHNPSILLEKYDEFFPTSKMSKIQRYNAITRYIIYLIVLLIIFRFNTYFIVFCILILVFITYIGYTYKELTKNVINCRNSTYDNPVANPLIMNDDTSLIACNIDKNIRINNIRKNFYEDSYDTNKRRILDRTFYTLPVSNYPNDIRLIGGYLYNDKNNHCKVKKQQCEYYRDIRFKR